MAAASIVIQGGSTAGYSIASIASSGLEANRTIGAMIHCQTENSAESNPVAPEIEGCEGPRWKGYAVLLPYPRARTQRPDARYRCTGR